MLPNIPSDCAGRTMNSWQAGCSIQAICLLVSVRAYQSANSVFLSQEISTSQTYQPKNQPANRLYPANRLIAASTPPL